MRIATLLAACSVLHATTLAQTCGGTPAPDLVVSFVSSPSNYAALGAIDACAFGLTLCNYGAQTVVVSASTNNHPVLMQNLYRYEVVNGASRFEQIGMSWAFHSYFMLENNTFCTCSAAGSGNLGAGCASPSISSALGAQTTLGPRSEIDAFSAAFPFPPSNPAYAGSVARRLQFALTDVDPALHPGAQFFVELIAISPQDASAGNASNNASYAPVTITLAGSEASVALAGPIVRARAAVYAWQALDPNVVVNVGQIPGEGAFLAASCATNLGGGSWHYEYALENMNSDFACGAVRVDSPAYVLPSNAGFHDVDYHDGDGPGGVNLDGTDWSASASLGSVQWSTQSFASNPSANALRATTTYSFRFDANAGPILGSAHLDTWKVASTLDVAAMVPSLPPPVGTAYCFGDGSGTPCPCGNTSAVGDGVGCLNSLSNGGKLRTFGVASLTNDSVVLSGSQMPNSSCLYFQGTAQQGPSGGGTAFGDGLRCAGGTVVRLATKTNVAGASSYPVGADVPISVKGLVPVAGATRTYQAWYRNAAAFCTVSTFNLSNGVEFTWAP
jgi:hypothetical protein